MNLTMRLLRAPASQRRPFCRLPSESGARATSLSLSLCLCLLVFTHCGRPSTSNDEAATPGDSGYPALRLSQIQTIRVVLMPNVLPKNELYKKGALCGAALRAAMSDLSLGTPSSLVPKLSKVTAVLTFELTSGGSRRFDIYDKRWAHDVAYPQEFFQAAKPIDHDWLDAITAAFPTDDCK